MASGGWPALTYKDMVEVLGWLWNKQMYLWKLDYTMERLEKARNELKSMVAAAESSMRFAEHNGRPRIEMADAWVKHGEMCIRRANDVLEKYSNSFIVSINEDEPSSSSIDVWSSIVHGCPCEAVARRTLNSKAILRMNEIHAQMQEGRKYATKDIKDVSYSIVAGPSPPPVLLHGTMMPNYSLNKSFVPASDIQRMQLSGFPKYRAVRPSTSLARVPVVIRVDAPAYSRRSCAPVDLVMVLDASARMCVDGKLETVKQGSMFVVHNLDSKDRLSIVTFGKQRVVLPLTHMSEEGKRKARTKVRSLRAVGSSTFGPAMDLAYQTLDNRLDKSSVTNILLLTGCEKGIFEDQSLRHTQVSWSKPNYPTYTFGFGLNHDPQTLYYLATGGTRGYGTYSFVTENLSIRDAMALYVGGLTSIVAQNVEISVKSAHRNVEISSMECGGHRARVACDGKSRLIYIKDLYASEEKNFIVYVNIPAEEAAANGFPRTAATTKLLTVNAKYYCPLTGTEDVLTDEVDIFVERPVWGQDSNMSIEVASEVTRANVFKGVNYIWLSSSQCTPYKYNMNFHFVGQYMKRQLDILMDSIGKTKEAIASGERWDGLREDLYNMKSNISDICTLISLSKDYSGMEDLSSQVTGSPYMLSWLSSHRLQRAATPGFVSQSKWFSFRTIRMQNMIDSV